jgi:hypothetical protein
MENINTASNPITGTTVDGEPYISHAFISYGDYDNSCAVERANVRWLEQNYKTDLLLDHGAFYSVTAWLPDTEEYRELLAGLDDYPCFDDELVSEIEQEIEDEYINRNDDIHRLYTPQPLKDILSDLDLTEIDSELYYQAKDNCNVQFVVEAGGNGYINLSKLADEYNLLLCDKYPAIKIISELQEQLAACSPPPFPLSFYASAQDMLEHRTATGQPITPEEARALLLYAAELEEVLECRNS